MLTNRLRDQAQFEPSVVRKLVGTHFQRPSVLFQTSPVEHLAFEQGAIDENDELDSLIAAHFSLANLRDTTSFGELPHQTRLYSGAG